MQYIRKFWPLYLVAAAVMICAAMGTSRVVTTIAENTPVPHSVTLIIDAGHGGVDGGATSCTGVLESAINLQIALRLEDVSHLLGYRTCMIRRSDVSVYTEGNTIAAQKASDLRHRARMVNETEGAILLSIHQNIYADSRYAGAQVFFAPTEGSEDLAKALQRSLQTKRECKLGRNIYLLQHIQRPGVLIECGFLSNPQEEQLLRNPQYQKKLCCQIISGISAYLQA